MADRQYIVVRFGPRSTREYTYHNDREPVAVGDSVVVSTDRGPSTVTVVALLNSAPPFATKPIVGKERPISQENGNG